MTTDNAIEQANAYAGEMGGEYLESIDKTDLATLTKEEWETFIDCVTKNYELKKIELSDDCPF